MKNDAAEMDWVEEERKKERKRNRDDFFSAMSFFYVYNSVRQASMND